MLSLTLAFEGCQVVTAANGAEALHLARGEHPQLILLDLMMPVMDGYQFAREQHADPALAEIPVVCISGTHNAALAATRIGAVACFEKPIELDGLVSVVRKLVIES